ncbi:MAG: hypothetical protein QOF37_2019 [Thermoleophilaceae bacterium]|nr:hypothetical protein [Thermoleophilaceae bacterium]
MSSVAATTVPNRNSRRHASARAASGTVQTMYCGESTLPKVAYAATAASEASSNSRRPGRRMTPIVSSAMTANPSAATAATTAPDAGCSTPSERKFLTLRAPPIARSTTPGMLSTCAGRAVCQCSASFVPLGDSASMTATATAITAPSASAPRSASRCRPRPTSHASATGATTIGKNFIATPAPSTANPATGRSSTIRSRAASVSATGARSKWLRMIAPVTSGASATAAMASHSLPPVARASARTSSRTQMAKRNIRPAKSTR